MSNLKGYSPVFATFPLHLQAQLVFLKVLVSFIAIIQHVSQNQDCKSNAVFIKGDCYGLQGYPESAPDQI